jgi:hypothetical protein
VFFVAEFFTAVGDRGVVAVALDAPHPGGFAEAVSAAGSLAVLRPGDDSGMRVVRSTRFSTTTGSSRRRAS